MISRHYLIAGFVLLNLLVRLWIALQPLERTDGMSIPDDTYLSLTLARNIAHGLGPSYAGELTNGFQPLFVFCLVPVFLPGAADPILPVHAASVLSSLLDSMTLLIVLTMVARRSGSHLAIFPVALAWILNPAGIRAATNGMETSMACFFLACGLSMMDYRRGEDSNARAIKSCIAIGLVVGLGMLARIDNILLGVITVAAILVEGRADLRSGIRPAAALACAAFLVYLPWLAYSYAATGDLFPVSGKAIRLMSLATVDFNPTLRNWYGLTLGAGFGSLGRTERAVLVTGGATLVAILSAGRGQVRRLRDPAVRLVPAISYSVLLFGAYTLYVFGPWFFERYLFPIAVVVSLIFGALIGALLERMSRRLARVLTVSIIAALVVVLDVTDPEFGMTLNPPATTSLGYMNLGLWAKKTFPPGTVIGSAQSGALGYFADSLLVINLDGVVSKSCYESLLHFRSLEYIRERRVQYVVGWYSNFQYLEHQSDGSGMGALGAPRKIDGFQSWGYDWYLAGLR